MSSFNLSKVKNILDQHDQHDYPSHRLVENVAGDSKGPFQWIARELTCAICHNLIDKPCRLEDDYVESCGHLFCESCISSWLRNLADYEAIKCPTCRKEFQPLYYRNRGRFTQGYVLDQFSSRLLANLQFKCSFPTCPFTGNEDGILAHIDKDHKDEKCLFSKVGCNFSGHWNDVLLHMKDKNIEEHDPIMMLQYCNHSKPASEPEIRSKRRRNQVVLDD
jgi:hypothetical protein